MLTLNCGSCVFITESGMSSVVDTPETCWQLRTELSGSFCACVRVCLFFVFFDFNIIVSFINEFERTCVMVTAVWPACGPGSCVTDWNTQLPEH